MCDCVECVGYVHEAGEDGERFFAIELQKAEANAETMRAMLLKVDSFLKANLDHAKAAEIHDMIRKTLEDCA